MFRTIASLGVAALAASGAALAAEPDFVSGRPGKNESPIVVPGGYLQIETEAARIGKDKEGGVTTDSLSIAASSLRYGLGGGYEAELILQPYVREKSRGPSGRATQDGLGDATLRVRKNLIGQDGGAFAAAVIAYVTLPAPSGGLGSDNVGGGVLLPVQRQLTDKLSFAGTLGLAAIDSETHAHRDAFDPSLALGLGYSFTDKVGGFVELYADRALEDGAKTNATFDFGATYLAAPTLQLDAGINLGLSDAATDQEVYIGIAHRF